MKRKQLADGSWTGQYLYDLRGNLTAIDSANVTSGSEPDLFLSAASFNARGQMVSKTGGNGVTSTYTYNDARGFLSRIQTVNGATSLLDVTTALKVKNGTTVVQVSTYAYGDGVNLTGITDVVTAANSNALSYKAINRLASASGAWGNAAYVCDPVGNRLSDVVTGALNTSRHATIDSFSNRITGKTENGAVSRTYTYDNAGNNITDVRPGETFSYTYNKCNRLASVTHNGVAYATYIYNTQEQAGQPNHICRGLPCGHGALYL